MEIPGSAQPLEAILALPTGGEKPHGLVVFVHGDGPADASRDSFYRPLWSRSPGPVMPSVSWNKPGVEGAQGNWLHQSMHDRAVETEAVLTWARSRGDIDPHRIGLWGISQAGWALPEVAALHPELRFMILVGPAINWLRQGEYNLLAELRAQRAGDPRDRRRAATPGRIGAAAACRCRLRPVCREWDRRPADVRRPVAVRAHQLHV